MATITIKNSNGQTQQVTPDQLQTIDPWLYSKYVQNVAQPAAGLKQTEVSTGATGASAANAAASLPGIQANTAIDQSKALLLKDQGSISDTFAKNLVQSGSDKGYVDPEVYNSQKAQFIHDGGNAADFDGAFADNYVSPNNINYDTEEAKSIKGTLPAIKDIVNSYSSLPMAGATVSGLEELEKIPVLGQYLAQSSLLKAQNAHDTLLNGLALKVKGIVSNGSSQGFRNIGVLNGITDLLPSAEDSKGVANEKLDRLNSYLQDNMGVGLQDILGGGSQ